MSEYRFIYKIGGAVDAFTLDRLKSIVGEKCDPDFAIANATSPVMFVTDESFDIDLTELQALHLTYSVLQEPLTGEADLGRTMTVFSPFRGEHSFSVNDDGMPCLTLEEIAELQAEGTLADMLINTTWLREKGVPPLTVLRAKKAA